MSNSITFTGCVFLDYDGQYVNCKKQSMMVDGKEIPYWRRPKMYDGCPVNVQFCKKRGRLNRPESCVNEGNKKCSDYQESPEREVICEG